MSKIVQKKFTPPNKIVNGPINYSKKVNWFEVETTAYA